MFVYILRCRDGTLYTGIASDAVRRFRQHLGELPGGAKYTRSHIPVSIEAVWNAESETAARKLEYYLKKLKKEKKEMLIKYPERVTDKGFCSNLSEYSFHPENIEQLINGISN